LADDPYPQAEVVDLGDDPGPDDEASRARAFDALLEVWELHRTIDPRLPPIPVIDDAPARAAYEIAALAPIGPLDAQRVLEAASVADRLDRLTEMLGDHAGLLRPDPGQG
jgi:Lon protease-like protein